MKILKGIALTVGGVVALVVIAFACIWVFGGKAANATVASMGPSVTLDTAHADVERGKHLYLSVASCGDCHRPSAGGAVFLNDPAFGLLSAPNLTSGKGGVGGRYSDADFERAIRHGLRADGSRLLIMPSDSYAAMSDADVAAIIAFIRTEPPVANAPPRRLGMVPRLLALQGKAPFAADHIDQGAAHPSTVPSAVDAAYGHYLTQIGGCMDCHGQGLSGGHLAGSPSDPPAQNITPAGIGSWSYADFSRAMRTGYRPDHTVIKPFMPWRSYAGMTEDELRAVYQYLKTVPSRPSGSG